MKKKINKKQELREKLLEEIEILEINQRYLYEDDNISEAMDYEKLIQLKYKDLENLEGKEDKLDKALKIAGTVTAGVGAVGAVVVPLIVCKHNNKALTDIIMKSWMAQMSGEVPAQITKEAFNCAMKKLTK